MRCYTLLLALCLAAPAAAESQCPPLKMIANVDLVPLEYGRHHAVPVEIAGVPKRMLINMGAEVSMISAATVEELKLPIFHSRTKIYSLTGSITDAYTTVPVKLGNLQGNINLWIDETLNGLSDDPLVAGLLGTDVLSNFDVSMDFGTKKFDLLSTDHCDGKVIYWPAQNVAVVPFKRWHGGKIVFDVTIDGKTVKAILDTGAYNSTMRIDNAERDFDVKPGSADTPAAGHLNEREDLTIYHHTFKTLDFSGIAVTNPVITLIPDKMTKKMSDGPELGSLLKARDDARDAPMLIGMNVLQHLHVYIAYREKKLYISAAGKPASAAQ